MKFSTEQLDRWATWLETETTYSLAKYPTEVQRGYFDAGVTRGDYPWKSSCINYLLRAVMRTVNGQPISGMELQVVQGLAKSAHNHLTCAAIGRMAAQGESRMLGHFADVVEDWRKPLAAGDVGDFEISREAVELQKHGFDSLQYTQDTEPQLFDRHVAVLGLPVQAAFIACAEKYGWPQPGISSSAGALPWEGTRT